MHLRLWNDGMIINHILSKKGREPLNSHYFSTHYPSVYAAAERIFGSWGNAITAAGLDYSKIRKYQEWDSRKITETIRNMRREGKSISSQSVQRNCKSLYMAAIHRYRSWGQAVQAAGISYKTVRQHRSMTPEEIKSEILRIYNSGEDLAYSNMRSKYSYLLACGSKKLGQGSWANARRACGIAENFRLPKAKRKRSRCSA